MKLFEFNEPRELQIAKKDGITHISTGVAVVNDNKILIARRVPDDFLGGWYELPGGGVDEGESIVEAAKREIQEELGLKIEKVLDIERAFDYETDKKPRVRQYNLVVTTIPGRVKLDPNEHDDYKYISEQQIDKEQLTVSIKKSLKMIFQLTELFE